jgi:hypothetical protein
MAGQPYRNAQWSLQQAAYENIYNHIHVLVIVIGGRRAVPARALSRHFQPRPRRWSYVESVYHSMSLA